jgi:metallo-beta-lactamase class B
MDTPRYIGGLVSATPVIHPSMPARVPASAALVTLLVAAPGALAAQGADTARAAAPVPVCQSCAEWNAPQRPFRIHGNSWYVGTHGLSAVLVTSAQGHVLLDGALPESAPHIAANVRALGFRMEDVRLILNSHAHFDHAGGIAALQRASGAAVAAHAWSAAVMRRGTTLPEDPQHGLDIPYPAVPTVRVLADDETVRIGPLALTAHFTGGHTPGGTSWSWRSCEDQRCLELVYADSQTPVSADGFLFTRSARYPSALQDFARGFAALERLRCDVLITPHPSASELFERLAAREQGRADAFRDPSACRRYAATARRRLAQRVATERATPGTTR